MNDKSRSIQNKIILVLSIILTFFVLHHFGYTQYISADYIKKYAAWAKQFVGTYYIETVLGFIGTLACAVASSLPLGILIPILGGFLFGWIPGVIYSIVGATIGAIIAFLAIRYLFGRYFQTRFAERLQSFNKELETYGYLYLLGLHFFPITPFFILNGLAALTQISFSTFVWTTIVGVAPAYTLYAYIGHQVTEIDKLSDVLSKEIAIAFIGLKVLSALTLLIGRFGHKLKKTAPKL